MSVVEGVSVITLTIREFLYVIMSVVVNLAKAVVNEAGGAASGIVYLEQRSNKIRHSAREHQNRASKLSAI